MKSLIKYSVIIPTYNRSELLVKCIESWINQSISSADYEIIIVDNNSSDNTFDIVNKYILEYNNIKYVKEQRPGLVYVRHTGAKVALSEYLIYADDDGIYNDTCIEEILKVYKMHPKVVAVGGKIDILWDKKPPAWVIEKENLLGKINLGNDVVIANDIFINGGLFSIKKRVLYELNGFNPDQIGDFLIGDGESGLVIKIHKNKYLIAWTPYAKMQHIQFVDKHATLKDMGRRYYNYGITVSYGILRENDFKFSATVAKYFIKTFLMGIKKLIKYIIVRNTKKYYNSYFALMHKKGELAFFIHLSSKQLRKNCKNDNWF